MAYEPEEGTPCQRNQHCGCGDDADVVLGDVPICGCCAADYPDVHGPNGLTWRRGHQARLLLADDVENGA